MALEILEVAIVNSRKGKKSLMNASKAGNDGPGEEINFWNTSVRDSADLSGETGRKDLKQQAFEASGNGPMVRQ